MTQLTLWQIDAFTDKPFAGNPAAVIPLDGEWPDDHVLQAIAAENNLSETAFFRPVTDQPGHYDLRWFTPVFEVDLCGHATLATAWLIFTEIGPDLPSISFHTRSGELIVHRQTDGRLAMRLPADTVQPFNPPTDGFAEKLAAALDVPPPAELFIGRYLIAVWERESTIRAINGLAANNPELRSAKSWGLIVTAPDGAYDFVSRFFAPDKGVPEDPVTGSAHCGLAPFWSKRLGKTVLRAKQISRRGGEMECRVDGQHVTLIAPCALYMRGQIIF